MHARPDGHTQHLVVDRVLLRDNRHAPGPVRVPVLCRFRERGVVGSGGIPREIDDTRERRGVGGALHADQVQLVPGDVDREADEPEEHGQEQRHDDERLAAVVPT